MKKTNKEWLGATKPLTFKKFKKKNADPVRQSLAIPEGYYGTVLFFTRKFDTGYLLEGYRGPLDPMLKFFPPFFYQRSP